MNDLFPILDAIPRLRAPAVLATLVRVDGSSFRRPGARMLITPDQHRVGSITGPCLETEITRQAASLAPDSHPVLLTYDTAREDDAIFGYGLACPGMLHILLEPLDPAHEPPYLSYLRESLSGGQTVALATVYALQGPAPLEVGSRLMLRSDDVAMSGVWPADLAAPVIDAAQQSLQTSQSVTTVLDYRECSLSIFIEIIHAPARLFIFGATDPAGPLVRLAKELAWHVTLHDRRPAYADPARFPQADEILACPVADLLHEILITDRSAAVIMTHNYPDDLALLSLLLTTPIAYIGLLSSRQRAQKLIHDLAQRTTAIAPGQLARLHTPVCLDIGAESPPEIALSILAEIQAALSARSAQPLRTLNTPIHDRGPGQSDHLPSQ